MLVFDSQCPNSGTDSFVESRDTCRVVQGFLSDHI